MTAPVLELADVSKDYRGLRPLRIQQLTVFPGEHLAIVGMDQPMAEVFVNLVTGAALPDRGDVKVFERSTSAIRDSAEWLTLLDRFGIVTDRAVLLEALTLLQNLAVPFTLDIESLSEDHAIRVANLAREIGLPDSEWMKPVAALDAAARARVRIGRALALNPTIMLLEHPTAALDRDQAAPLGLQIRSVVHTRGAASIAVTADPAFAAAVADRVLTLDAATGRLSESRRGWRFGRRLG